MREGRLSLQLREEADAFWEGSFRHPFIQEVAKGTLPLDTFAFYVTQDAYYLSVFAQVQALAGAKAGTFSETKRWAEHVQKTYEVEAELHERFFKRLNLKKEDAFRPAPTSFAYTRHLLTVGYTGSIIEIIAAMLPCYWLYGDIGKRLVDAKPGVDVYQDWINAYGLSEFEKLVQEQITTLDSLAETSSRETIQRVRNHFLISSRYEYMFWEMAYHKETWPLSTST